MATNEITQTVHFASNFKEVRRLIAECVGTLNAKKIGKHRRGSLMLTDVRWTASTGTAEIIWRAKGIRSSSKCRATTPRRFRIYRHSDHGLAIAKIIRAARSGHVTRDD